jgi:hypothetical protein
MSSDKARAAYSEPIDADVEARSEAGVLERLLDPAFGLVIWALHFTTSYVIVSVQCAVAGAPDAAGAAGLRASLVGLTLAAVGVVAVHSARRYAARRSLRDHQFLLGITLGHNAIACVAMLWLLFPILETPLCQ